MSFSFDELVQGAIESIILNVLWRGITRLFRFWSKWVDWTSPAGILLIVINVLFLGMFYFAHIRFLDFWRGAFTAAMIMFVMLMLIHNNIMARFEEL